MNHITIASRGKFAGDYVLRNEPDVSLGTYLEVVYTGPQTVERAGSFIVYLFPVVIRHSLIHDDDHFEAELAVASTKVAVFLSSQLRSGQAHILRSVRYTHKNFTWYWPGVDDYELNLDGPVRRRT